MTASPTLHTFDPQLSGKIGLSIDPQGLVVGDQVAWYVSNTSGGPYSQVATTFVHGAGLDALALIFDAGGPFYCVAKAAMTGSWSPYSNEVSAVVSAGLTQAEHLQAALGGSYSPGDIVEVFPPTPTVSKTVNADGSIS